MASDSRLDDSESDDTNEQFSVRSVTLQMQNKMIGMLPSGILRFLLDESSVRLFDNICSLLKLYSGSTKIANTYTKRIVKMNVRLAVYSAADSFNDEESNLVYDFHDRCHLAAELVLRLGCPNRRLLPGVRPSMEKLFEAVIDAKNLVNRIMERHLNEETREKFKVAVDYFVKSKFFETVFGSEPCYTQLMKKIYDDLEDLMDRGLI